MGGSPAAVPSCCVPSQAGPSPHVLWDAAYDMGGTEVRGLSTKLWIGQPKTPQKNYDGGNFFVIKKSSKNRFFFVGPATFLKLGFDITANIAALFFSSNSKGFLVVKKVGETFTVFFFHPYREVLKSTAAVGFPQIFTVEKSLRNVATSRNELTSSRRCGELGPTWSCFVHQDMDLLIGHLEKCKNKGIYREKTGVFFGDSMCSCVVVRKTCSKTSVESKTWVAKSMFLQRGLSSRSPGKQMCRA